MVLTSHAYILLEDNSLWAVGTNIHGELGVSDRFISSSLEPRKIADDIIDLSSGEDYGIFLDYNLRLIVVGKNNLGQIGVNEPVLYTPTSVFLRDSSTGLGVQFISVSCGTKHSCVIDTNKKLWATGFSNVKQIPTEKSSLPEWTKLSVYDPVTNNELTFDEVHCGIEHTILLSEDRKKIYSCGSNLYYELGIGTNANARAVNLVMEAKDADTITKILNLKSNGLLGDSLSIPQVNDGDLSLTDGTFFSTSREPLEKIIWNNITLGYKLFDFKNYIYSINNVGEIVALQSPSTFSLTTPNGRIIEETGIIVAIDSVTGQETVTTVNAGVKTTTYLYFFYDANNNYFCEYNGKVYKLDDGVVTNLGYGSIKNGDIPLSNAPSERLEDNYFKKLLVIDRTNFALENDGTLWAWGYWIKGKTLGWPQKVFEEVLDIKVTGNKVYAQIFTDNITDNAYSLDIPSQQDSKHRNLERQQKITYWENPRNKVKRTTSSLFLEIKIERTDWVKVF